MKKLITIFCMFIIFLINNCSVHAQGMTVVVNPPTVKQIYVGSLPKDINHGGNRHKLRVEIMGGDFSSTKTQIYSIATRVRPVIRKEIYGGNNNDIRYNLKVYENEANLDFVVETTGEYTSIWIQSWVLGNNSDISTMEPVNLVEYDIKNKKEVSSMFSTEVLLSLNSANGTNNVGIGTDSPQAKLDVRGKIIADEVQIKVNKGADFVFNPDYQLTPLSEVESFVKENKHLPEIPSEKQMIEEGVSVNDMQIKLLQKIEELTLYVIELDKENKEIKAENISIRKELNNLKFK